MGQTEHKNIKIRSRKDLEAIRERTRPLLEVERGARIVVGMGTCGLAAGARQVYEAMAEDFVFSFVFMAQASFAVFCFLLLTADTTYSRAHSAVRAAKP